MEELPVKIEWEGEGVERRPVPYVPLSAIPEPAQEIIRAHYVEMNAQDGNRKLTDEERERVERNAGAIDSTAEVLPDEPVQLETPVTVRGANDEETPEIPAEVLADLEGFDG